ncbi:uncharacterized protein LOC108035876 [Drosophila biarmipes]|uniref:uncharacterized protein LOC108035876 n=1 Tax=Drosophila biarmipes TaxID=125945 RepID=UPI0007E7A946|nr:uncharacterized protein LOC108035876 [Drosophila biarmipes]
MAPDAEKPQTETRFCALGSHRLRTPFRTISNETLRNFARLLNNDFNSESLICKNCYSELFKLYMKKVSNAKRHKLQKMADTVSDISSQQADSSSEQSGITPAPLGRTLLPFNLSSVMETSAHTSAIGTVGVRQNLSQTSDDLPTTSAAAAKKRQRSERNDDMAPPPRRPRSEQSSQDDDDYAPNSNLSLNAVNGTRLPHIQPIPRRRPTVHLNKEAMDIYLQGTTGG